MKVIKTIESFAKESRYNRVIEAAVRAGEESKEGGEDDPLADL